VNTAKRSFSITRLLELLNNELSEEKSASLNLALQSLAKRLSYCEYHHQEYLENSTGSKLIRERLGPQSNNFTRIKYEANFLAFINNLHCTIDAVPYALNIIYQHETNIKIDHPSVSWNLEHIELYRKLKVSNAINAILNCDSFETLKELSNRSKHKHLTPLSNNYENLTIASFRYNKANKSDKSNPIEIIVPCVSADGFMAKCHESLIPLVVDLFNEIILTKEAEQAIHT
jgi:hypothetical protein